MTMTRNSGDAQVEGAGGNLQVQTPETTNIIRTAWQDLDKGLLKSQAAPEADLSI